MNFTFGELIRVDMLYEYPISINSSTRINERSSIQRFNDSTALAANMIVEDSALPNKQLIYKNR
ncbi:hypothetical protein GCM10023331_30940 [Algivirga pacifica]|uniref:Uncharacterized protein n=1 Tax=Algivirga pacifica TaxID=1162670 RepID=A0ABP9DHW0_9BACT